ncbi:hypothetical protein [Streptomyces pseudogriseolus]|uniref:hypothetical protein n=1 Tax=Streptomyces pseudogriseolus TaxID=36817 RepID=UPI003FA33E50
MHTPQLTLSHVSKAYPGRIVLDDVSFTNRASYERSRFKHCTDADGDGCNTRAEVLEAEGVIAPEQCPRCASTGGEWCSP